MAWQIELTDSAAKALRKMDPQAARRITEFLRRRVAGDRDPRHLAKSLKGELNSYWRFRVGDFRLICDIQDQKLRVLVIRIAHRREVYRD